MTAPITQLTALATTLLAILLATLVAPLLSPAPARAQTAGPHSPAFQEPYWLHITPIAGAVAVSRPGEAGGPVAALQLEVSRNLPVGIGVTAGYWFPRGVAAPDGPFLEATLAYRFHLRARGRLSPYAGPVAGAIRDDTGEIREIRGFFGGRAGVDIPAPGPWPTLRLEASYRHLSEAAGRGTGDTLLLLVGGRWSIPFAAAPPPPPAPPRRRGG
jgi:hypothetical protein